MDWQKNEKIYPEIGADIMALYKGLNNLVGSLGNWVSYFARTGGGGSQGLPNNQTGPSNTCVAALTIQAKTSGMFFLWCNVSWSGGTNGDTVLQRLWINDVTPGVLAGTGFLAAGFSGANASGSSIGSLNADAAGGNGITVDGNPVSGFATSQSIGAFTTATLTGLLSAQGQGDMTFAFSGIVGKNNNTTKAPVTIGHKLFAGFAFSATNVIQTATIQMGAVEIPIG